MSWSRPDPLEAAALSRAETAEKTYEADQRYRLSQQVPMASESGLRSEFDQGRKDFLKTNFDDYLHRIVVDIDADLPTLRRIVRCPFHPPTKNGFGCDLPWFENDEFFTLRGYRYNWTRHRSCTDEVLYKSNPDRDCQPHRDCDPNRDVFIAPVPHHFLASGICDVLEPLAAYADRRGFRFAMELEMAAFAAQHPWSVNNGNSIIALGASRLHSSPYSFRHEDVDVYLEIHNEGAIRHLHRMSGPSLDRHCDAVRSFANDSLNCGLVYRNHVLQENDRILLVKKTGPL